jgi:hypothetical protein
MDVLVIQTSSALVLTLTLGRLAISRVGERLAARFASASTAWVIAVPVLCCVVLRLALLPWLPVPEPQYHDEFGHLLVADTLTQGRLANPPHPLARHLDSIYVLQAPTYASVYTLGQGLALAAGHALFGEPWAGVLLANGLMCGAVAWMLLAVLSAPWALLGGLLTGFAYAFAGWMDCYWGGSLSAFSGALLWGALARLWRTPTSGIGALAGFGWGLNWLIRPFESSVACLFVWPVLCAAVARARRRGQPWKGALVAMLLVQGAAGALSAWHNHSVTGSFLTFPQALDQAVNGYPQSFAFQAPIERSEHRFLEAQQVYRWQREFRERRFASPFAHVKSLVGGAWRYFITPWFTLPFLLGMAAWREWPVRGAVAALGTIFAGSLLYPYFFPHYVGAAAGLFMFLIVRGLVTLNSFSRGALPVGRLLALFLVLGGSASVLHVFHPLPPYRPLMMAPTPRAQLQARLAELDGADVVFVVYERGHDFTDEWVYNAADIDASPIVWCRSLGLAEDAEVGAYYRDRRLWLASVGRKTVRVAPYPSAALNRSAGGAAIGPAWDFRIEPFAR